MNIQMMNVWVARMKKTYRLLPPLLSRNMRERYAGSIIGVFWTIIQPLLTMLVFWIIFSQIIKVRVIVDTGEMPYLAFLLSGIMPWFALQEGAINGASSIVDKEFIIKKVFYPSELFPLSAVLGAFVHHGTGLLIFLIIFFIYQGGITFSIIPALFSLVFLQMLLTTGIAFFLSALSVYIRDVLQIVGIVFQTFFYMTTILYPLTSVPERFKKIIVLNPFTHLIEGYHNVILYGKYPELTGMVFLSIFSAAVFLSGVYIFRKLKKGFADIL